jgi:hypothetical protein
VGQLYHPPPRAGRCFGGIAGRPSDAVAPSWKAGGHGVQGAFQWQAQPQEFGEDDDEDEDYEDYDDEED